MKIVRLARPHVFLLALVAVMLSACVDYRFVVDHVADLPDHNPGDGVCAALVGYLAVSSPPSPVYACTLRAAIEEANALGGYVEVKVLPHPSYGHSYEFDRIVVTSNVVLEAAGRVNLRGAFTFGAGARAILMGFDHYDSPGTDSCVEVFDAQVFIFQTTFSGCEGNMGGALSVRAEGTVFVESSIFEFNNAYVANGGAIYNNGLLSVRRSAFFDNSAFGGGVGGAIYNDVDGELFLANTALNSEFHGALVNRGGATLANATITDSSSNSRPGLSGGLTNLVPGSVVIRNTLLADNGSGDCVGTLSSEGFNVIEDDSAGACVTTGGATFTDQVGVLTVTDSVSVEVYPFASVRVGVPNSFPAYSAGYRDGHPGVPGRSPEACETRDLVGADRRDALRCDVGAVQVSP